MNPITYALQQVLLKIPRRLLDEAFIGRQSFFGNPLLPVSLETRIRSEIVEPRVMTDCNLIGGTQINIPLMECEREYIDAYNVVYRVPKRLTQGRTITRVLSLAYGAGSYAGSANIAPLQNNLLLDAASAVLNSNSPTPLISTAYCHLIGENTFVVPDTVSMAASLYVRCWLENDANFNHLEPTSYKLFAELVVLAVKAYIYNQLVIAIDEGLIVSGGTLGAFKEKLESYSDADEQYELVFKERWQKVATGANDYNARVRRVQMMMGRM